MYFLDDVFIPKKFQQNEIFIKYTQTTLKYKYYLIYFFNFFKFIIMFYIYFMHILYYILFIYL
jgi:hypothetical protein